MQRLLKPPYYIIRVAFISLLAIITLLVTGDLDTTVLVAIIIGIPVSVLLMFICHFVIRRLKRRDKQKSIELLGSEYLFDLGLKFHSQSLLYDGKIDSYHVLINIGNKEPIANDFVIRIAVSSDFGQEASLNMLKEKYTIEQLTKETYEISTVLIQPFGIPKKSTFLSTLNELIADLKKENIKPVMSD